MSRALASWGRWREQLGLRFALHYALFAGALFAIYAFPFELFGSRRDWLQGYLDAYAHLAGGVLSVFERGIFVEGALIHGRFPLQVVRNCDAAEVNILFLSATLAVPAAWRRKLPLALLGMLCLVCVNVLRICSLYFIGVHAPSWFKLAHEEVWPLLMVAAASATFLVCLRHIDRPALAAA